MKRFVIFLARILEVDVAHLTRPLDIFEAVLGAVGLETFRMLLCACTSLTFLTLHLDMFISLKLREAKVTAKRMPKEGSRFMNFFDGALDLLKRRSGIVWGPGWFAGLLLGKSMRRLGNPNLLLPPPGRVLAHSSDVAQTSCTCIGAPCFPLRTCLIYPIHSPNWNLNASWY